MTSTVRHLITAMFCLMSRAAVQGQHRILSRDTLQKKADQVIATAAHRTPSLELHLSRLHRSAKCLELDCEVLWSKATAAKHSEKCPESAA